MHVMSNGKIRRTEEEWTALVESFRSSGLSLKRYCEQEGLAASSLRKWLDSKNGRPANKAKRASGEKEGFIELAASKNGTDWSIEIELRNGTVLRLR